MVRNGRVTADEVIVEDDGSPKTHARDQLPVLNVHMLLDQKLKDDGNSGNTVIP